MAGTEEMLCNKKRPHPQSWCRAQLRVLQWLEQEGKRTRAEGFQAKEKHA